MSYIYTPFQPTLTEAGLKRFGISLVETLPGKTLEGVIHSYLQITASQPTLYPVMPDGMIGVYMSASGTMIGGAQTKAMDIPLLNAGEYFGIRFLPGAIRYFFDLDLSEISGQMVDQAFFPCDHFKYLHGDIYRYQRFDERVLECEKWLLSLFKEPQKTRFDEALSSILKNNGYCRVGQLANDLGWSSRHLNRQFLQHTGLSTKTFSQIVRVQRACRDICSGGDGMTNAPAERGYFDQPHLIKEFNRYYLSSPRVLFNRFMSDSYNQ